MKCADCFCDNNECTTSPSPFECHGCILEKCCCWKGFHKKINYII